MNTSLVRIVGTIKVIHRLKDAALQGKDFPPVVDVKCEGDRTKPCSSSVATIRERLLDFVPIRYSFLLRDGSTDWC